MKHYERRLPHWDVIGQPLFVTFRLHGSLPANRAFPPERLTNSGQAFLAMDRLLDKATTGPLYLMRPEIATLVQDALRDGEHHFHRYHLHAFVIMPNHVHLLVTPQIATARWLGPPKGFTSHQANRRLGTQGNPFWQDESYDRLVRSDTEFDRIRTYIEQNPVTAGLVATPDQFQWSSTTAFTNKLVQSCLVGQPFLAAAAFPGGSLPTPPAKPAPD